MTIQSMAATLRRNHTMRRGSHSDDKGPAPTQQPQPERPNQPRPPVQREPAYWARCIDRLVPGHETMHPLELEYRVLELTRTHGRVPRLNGIHQR